MKSLIAIALSSLVLSSAIAGVSDVVPKKFVHGSPYVRVTKVGTDKVRFEKCIKGYEKNGCDYLGRKKAYTMKSLIKQRQIENREAAGTIVADVAIIAGMAFTGGALAGGVFGGFSQIGSGIFFIDAAGKVVATAGTAGGVAVGGTLGAAATAFDPLNPVVQVNQARSLNTEILDDETVTRSNMEAYIRYLDTVLSKIP